MNYAEKMLADFAVADVLKSLTNQEQKILLQDAIGVLASSALKLRELCSNQKIKAALSAVGTLQPSVQFLIDFAFICKEHGKTKQSNSVPVGKPSAMIAYSDIFHRTNGAGVSVSFKGNSIYTYESGRYIAEDKVPASFDISEELALAIVEALN